jgi:hypothetical protein
MFLIPSLILAAVAAGAPIDPQIVSPEPARQLVRSIYAELIGSNTSYTTGQTTPAAEAMAKRLLDAGFPREDVVVAGAAPHKANVVVRYRGTGKAKPLLLLAHLDVVEAKREDWSVDPFTLLEKDGYFYGRGTGDDKAQAAIWVANLIRYKQEGFRPARDLVAPRTRRTAGLQRRGLAAEEPPRADRRRAVPQRGRLGRDPRRQTAREPHPGRRKLRDLSARSQERAGTARCRSARSPPGRRAHRLAPTIRGPAQRVPEHLETWPD